MRGRMSTSLGMQSIRAAVVCIASLGLGACSTEEAPTKTTNKNIILDPLIVSDKTLSAGNGSSSDVTGVALTSYKETIYPILLQRCANCHASAVAPLFAANDATKSYDSISKGQKFDANDLPKSRLVVRLKDDRHNCWGNCEENAQTMLAAITSFVEKSGVGAVNVDGLPVKSTGLKLTDSRFANLANPNANGAWKFESEAGLLDDPMQPGSNRLAVGRKFVQQTLLPVGVTDAQMQAAATHSPPTTDDAAAVAARERAARIGRVKFPFEVRQAGNHFIQGRISAPLATANSFFVRITAVGAAPGAVTQWNIPVNVANQPPFRWVPLNNNATPPAPLAFNLAAGRYELEVIARGRGTQLDAVVIAPSATVDATTLQDSPVDVRSLVYDLSSTIPGVTFLARVEDHSAQSFKISRPYLATTTHTVWIRQVVPLINGKSSPQSAMFNLVDVAIPPPGRLLSEGAMVVLKGEGGTVNDQISFGFGALERLNVPAAP